MSSQYRDRIYLGLDEDGNELIKWASGSSKTEFHDAIVRLYIKYGKIDRFLAEAKHPLMHEGDTRPPVLFKDYKDKWLNSLTACKKPIKPTTLSGYNCYLRKHLIPEFGEMDLFEITAFDIQEYFNEKSDLSLKTLREHHQVLKQIFDFAIDDEEINLPRNPAKNKNVKVNYSEKDSKPRSALPSSVIQEIIAAIYDLPTDQRRLMALYLFTGMRRGEVLALRGEDFDFDKGFINVSRNATYPENEAFVTTPKTVNGLRSLPLYEQLIELLGPIRQKGYIIGDGMKPITLMAYRWMFWQIRASIDLHGATAHVFRHSYLTMLDESGVDPKTLQYIAGHGNFSFTMNRYVHGRKEAALSAGVKFTELLQSVAVKKEESALENDNLRIQAEGHEKAQSA